MKTPKRHTAAFSLVELMIVVGIISILSALAIPQFYMFRLRAYRAEVSLNINAIYTLMETYRTERDPSSGIVFNYGMAEVAGTPTNACYTNTFGFQADCTKLRYFYSGTLSPGTAPFSISATNERGGSGIVKPGGIALYPVERCNGGEYSDRWTKDGNGTIQSTSKVEDTCS